MDKTPIHLLSVDRALAERIQSAMGEHVHVHMVQSLEADELADARILIMDHAALSPERSLTTAITTVTQAAPGRPLILATQIMSADQVLLAMRAGVADLVEREASAEDIASVLTRVLNQELAGSNATGKMTLVLGADYEAAAFVATDIALALCKDGKPTLLVDFTLPSSTAEAYLDVKVEYGLASAIADIDRMDASLLTDALARHEPSGLSLLTFDGGTGAEPVGIAPSDIVRLMHMLRASWGHVVVSSGSLRHAGLLREFASQAQAIDIVCSQSIRELEATRLLLERVAPDTASAERMRLLVWQHDPAIHLDGRRMGDVLGIERVFNFAADRVAAHNALNAGQSLYLNDLSGPYAQRIRTICNIADGAKGSLVSFDRMRRAVMRQMERAV